MSRRAVQKLVEGYILRLKLDPNVTVHSLRVTANAIPDQQSRRPTLLNEDPSNSQKWRLKIIFDDADAMRSASSKRPSAFAQAVSAKRV